MTVIQQAMIPLQKELYVRKCQKEMPGDLCHLCISFFPWSISLEKMKWQQSSEHWESTHSSFRHLGLTTWKSSIQVFLVLHNQKAKAEWILVLHSCWCKNSYFTQQYGQNEEKEKWCSFFTKLVYKGQYKWAITICNPCKSSAICGYVLRYGWNTIKAISNCTTEMSGELDWKNWN